MSAATDLLHRLEEDVESMEHGKKPGEVVRVLYGGVFGAMPARDIQPASDDSLRITVRDRDGREHVLVAPVSQCSFIVSTFVPSSGEPVEKVILGFAQPSRPNRIYAANG